MARVRGPKRSYKLNGKLLNYSKKRNTTYRMGIWLLEGKRHVLFLFKTDPIWPSHFGTSSSMANQETPQAPSVGPAPPQKEGTLERSKTKEKDGCGESRDSDEELEIVYGEPNHHRGE
ncbi:hypothetical protein E2542_SST08454 [Spatholobus suberectus]|nr:hypothetical protein E2542_SST08454 [Spatholobus suberectus]